MKNDLLERIIQGDEAAWHELLKQHQEALTRFCRRFFLSNDETADAVQDAFLRAWQFRHTFRGDSSFKAWLYRIAENVCRNRLRGRGAPLSLDDTENTEVAGMIATGLPVAEQVAARQMVSTILERLEEPDRTIFVLYYQMELSSEEIARRLPRAMTMGPEAVRSRISRKIKKVIQMVGEQFQIRV